MTDSTIDEHAGDGSIEAGPTVEELFGPLEESRNDPPNDDVDPHSPETDLATIESRVDELAGRTADDVFDQFEQVRSEADDECDVDGVLADESPEDIIACAREGTDDSDGRAVLGDEADLEDLLLTERQAGSEFLWVETGDEETELEDEPAKASPEAAASRPADDAGSEEKIPETIPFRETGSEASPSDDVEDGESDDSDDASVPPENEDEVDVGEDGSSGFFGWLRRKLGSIF